MKSDWLWAVPSSMIEIYAARCSDELATSAPSIWADGLLNASVTTGWDVRPHGRTPSRTAMTERRHHLVHCPVLEVRCTPIR